MKGFVGYALLAVLQLGCGIFLIWNILPPLIGVKVAPVSWAVLELFEIGAIVGLLLGTGVSGAVLLRVTRQHRKVEDALRLASGAFMEVVEERFDGWGLTPAERDVALFSIKGFSTAEIAVLRDTSEGTVKAQTNAIYRKAGVTGRSQLLSLFIEEMVNGPDS
ncbi:helix-turn-helix transcriptional regulator [Primorskyibacter aestuariivivens]|uniref:helix-turn-helix transcriptional regulator n=1 Tax=Primorskyibacter aestuariivivens TaxID=1888912 RepID=UPI00230043AC|nr:helix-turn-helix transcriptional regulator [Primorskyibacter aestuariivivens]MDA7428371.1 helix-turn-helix transcriptional regulator [Primorskyibacter aestuariivivens]